MPTNTRIRGYTRVRSSGYEGSLEKQLTLVELCKSIRRARANSASSIASFVYTEVCSDRPVVARAVVPVRLCQQQVSQK